MKQEEICCIYAIEAISGNPKKIGWKNVGQSFDYFGRISRHFSLLKKDKHHSLKLQAYYNKYGKDSLTYYIIKKCQKNELDFWEKWFIKSFDSYKQGFNCTEGGNNDSPNKKKCIMQNIYTNEVIEIESRTAFANKYNLNRSDVDSVMNGKNHYTGDWFCPLNTWRPKFYQAISPTGKKVLIYKVQEFCKLNNLPSVGAFFGMLQGKVHSCHGWTTQNRKKINPREKDYLTFKVISPTGEIFEEKNAQAFSKQFGLCNTWFNKLIHGKTKQHKGWTLFEEKEGLCKVS